MNQIRRFCNYINDLFQLQNITGNHIYIIIHWIFSSCIVIITLFTTNVNHLCILLILVALDAFSIVVLHCCPLTLLERKYMKKNYCKEYQRVMRKSGINYKCTHEYECQLELLMHICLFVCIKLLGIMVIRLFHIRLVNNEVYL
jgi:hypothetical protein